MVCTDAQRSHTPSDARSRRTQHTSARVAAVAAARSGVFLLATKKALLFDDANNVHTLV